MLEADVVIREIASYTLRLLALMDRFEAGERAAVGAEARFCADALTCLLEEAPLGQRKAVDYLVDRFETLRASCMD